MANNGQRLRKQVIDYWDGALLLSPESSTCGGDPDLAYLDNAIENQRLERLLIAHPTGGERCLDIGAGYGRFTRLFLMHFSQVTLLEASARIFEQLAEFWGKEPQVRLHHGEFETYEAAEHFDLAFAGGVLYLYPDSMARDFCRKAQGMLADGGLLILRDFISIPEAQKVPSTYIEGSFCYYRAPDWWKDLAQELGLELLVIERSKPVLHLLRSGRVLDVLGHLGLLRAIRSRAMIRASQLLGDYRLVSSSIHTVFIVLRKP